MRRKPKVMPKLIFEGPLISFFGKCVEIKKDGSIIDLLMDIDKAGILIDKSMRIKPGIIILLNGKDTRLLDKSLVNTRVLSETDEVTFIPVNHGG
ncbi:ubiquitin [Sulfuracidifex metallicus DSM 6482 = JCM 9184]|nr:ubiquitin [Sulfuracidifex metallicus DSM 6482 = JCM 9184]